jgi:glycosyltransferase domain-containing protein
VPKLDITIFIPTYKDRTKYLRRSLDFYSRENFSGSIIIGDSSEDKVLSDNRELLQEFSNINIKHLYYPINEYPHDGFITNDISKHIETNFICFSGDDDFQVPSTLEYCVDFLRYNNYYVGAHGAKIKYSLSKDQIYDVRVVKGQYLDIDDPIFRFRSYMKSYTSPQYHVIRKGVWEKIYSFINKLPDVKFLTSEVLPCSLYYILGKVKRFDNLVQLFMEQTPDSYQNQNKDYIIKGINSSNWGNCSTAIREIIINELVKQGCNIDESEKAFDEEYNHRILNHFNDQFLSMYKNSFEDFFKKYNQFMADHDDQNSLTDEYFNTCLQIIIPSLKTHLEREYK